MGAPLSGTEATTPIMHALYALYALLAFVGRAHAWGAAGHQIVATIAQIHLFESTRQHIAQILPSWTDGKLAPVSAWPDRIRYANPWSGPLHYASPLDDGPPGHCVFDHGWRNERNVFSAIANYSQRIAQRSDDASADEDLRFLTHFVGDMHQPLHLMERERGGNGDPVIWEGRHASLHSLWDGLLIARAIRELHNYTRPSPSRQIERDLRGSIFDSYVRWILLEGVRVWWRSDLAAWLNCTDTLTYPGIGSSVSESAAPLHETAQTVLKPVVEVAPTCTTQWALPVHQLTCQYVFPDHYDDQPRHNTDLARTDYYEKLQSAKVIESLLAQAGLRLASALNRLLADPSELVAGGVNLVDLRWMEQDL